MKSYKTRTVLLPVAFFTLFFLLVRFSVMDDFFKRLSYVLILALTYGIAHFLQTVDAVEEMVLHYQREHQEDYPQVLSIWKKVSFETLNENQELGRLGHLIYSIQQRCVKIVFKS